MNVNKIYLAVGLILMFSVVLPMHSQTGCTDSPENPTVVLAIVGGVGALFTTVRARMRVRRGRSEQG